MAAATFYEIPKTTIWNSYKYFKKQTRSLCLVGLVKCYFLIQDHFGIPWADSGDTFQTYMEKPSLFFQDKIIYQYSVFSSFYLDHDVYHITPKTVLTRNHKFTRGQEEGSISGTRFFFKRWVPALNNKSTKQWQKGGEQCRSRDQLSQGVGAI